MILLYLNSLYRVLLKQNPLLRFWQQGIRNLRILWNLPRNRMRARQRLHCLEDRFQAMNAFVNPPNASPAPRRVNIHR